MLGTCCYLVNTPNPVPSWSSQYTIRQSFKLTLLTKSSQSMCKYRLCNLDLERSLHIEKGAVSSSEKACSSKALNIFQNILSSQCNGQIDSFGDTPQVSSLSLKEGPRHLCCSECLFTGLDSRLPALSKSCSGAPATAFGETGTTRNKLYRLTHTARNLGGNWQPQHLTEAGLNWLVPGHTVNKW